MDWRQSIEKYMKRQWIISVFWIRKVWDETNASFMKRAFVFVFFFFIYKEKKIENLLGNHGYKM